MNNIEEIEVTNTFSWLFNEEPVPSQGSPLPPVGEGDHSWGPHNKYCVSMLEPSLCSWLLLFWFLPSMQSR